MEGGQVLFRVGHAKSDDQSDKAWRAEAWVDRGMVYRLRASRYAGYLVCVSSVVPPSFCSYSSVVRHFTAPTEG